MKIAAITRYKQGDLYNALHRLGWSQAHLARELGLSQQITGHIINLKRKPSKEQADDIQRVFGDKGIYLDVVDIWPETFQPLASNLRVQLAEVELLSLEGNPTLFLEDKSTPILDNEDRKIVEDILDSLKDREKEMVLMRFFDGLTLEEMGIRLHLSKERVRQILKKALRKCRHPTRMRDLACIYERKR